MSIMNCRVFESSNKDVKKFVFSKDKEDGSKDIAVEAVLYRYGEYKTRTVICCSTQCGCPVGCSFCGTGKFFIRSLTCDEICEQVTTVLSTIDCETSEIKKFQIMFMSMGEPFLNYNNLDMVIRILHERYPNAQLLVSTSAPTAMKNHFDEFIALSKEIDKVGLQFSVHESLDENRRKLIPTNTSTLKEISEYGEFWASQVGRKVFYNYCVHPGNDSEEDADRLIKLFNPACWETTLSVICEKSESVKSSIERQLEIINTFAGYLTQKGASLRIFNPAGQDDIGGGCGQLWFFQEWLKKKNNN